jgi:hypothetical protein
MPQVYPEAPTSATVEPVSAFAALDGALDPRLGLAEKLGQQGHPEAVGNHGRHDDHEQDEEEHNRRVRHAESVGPDQRSWSGPTLTYERAVVLSELGL